MVVNIGVSGAHGGGEKGNSATASDSLFSTGCSPEY